MAKIIYCVKCSIKLGELAAGSKLKLGLVFLCANCEMQRKALELRYQNDSIFDSNSVDNPFNDLFGEIFRTGGKK